MNTTNLVLLTGLIIAVGRWIQDKPLTARIFVAIFILALVLTIIGQGQPKLANRLGMIVLVTAILPPYGYGASILEKLGYPVRSGGAAAKAHG